MASPTIRTLIRTLYVGRSTIDLPALASFLALPGSFSYTDHVESNHSQENFVVPDFDLMIFVIDAQVGVDGETIALWERARAYQIPRLITVTGLLQGEVDFDDIVLILNRVLDPVITPELILHDESGAPIGTISLEDLSTTDYSHTPPIHAHADSELREIVGEFREEYLRARDEFGLEGFRDGLLFPALPVIMELGIGKLEVEKFAALLIPTL